MTQANLLWQKTRSNITGKSPAFCRAKKVMRGSNKTRQIYEMNV